MILLLLYHPLIIKNQCLDITGRYCHKECLIVLHYVNYTSPNHLKTIPSCLYYPLYGWYSFSFSKELQRIFLNTEIKLKEYGLHIAVDKLQEQEPYTYLGYILQRNIIKPQKIQIQTDSLKTLNDFQKLLGDINWLWPSLAIPNHSLTHLFQILQGDSDLNSPQVLIEQAKQELDLVNQGIQQRQPKQVDLTVPISLLIPPTLDSPTGILWQP